MDLTDQIAKQDLFNLATNVSIWSFHVKKLSIFSPKNDTSELLENNLIAVATKTDRIFWFNSKFL
jgi:hypothetical protein